MTRGGLAWGVLFVAVGAVTLLFDLGIWTTLPDWLWPLALVALGTIVLLGGLLPDRRDTSDGG